LRGFDLLLREGKEREGGRGRKRRNGKEREGKKGRGKVASWLLGNGRPLLSAAKM